MINRITEYITRNENNFSYYMNKNFDENQILINYKKYVQEDNKIEIPFVSQIVSNVYPYIQKGIKNEIIEKSIEQGNCVHDIVSKSIKAKKSEKITLIKNECKNSIHISIAVKIISALNSFIYKHKIKYIYSEETFLSLSKFLYIGTPDIILENDRECFIIDIKTSRINFVEKAAAQLFLYKEMLESAGSRVHSCYILNPREEITIFEPPMPTMEEKRKIYKEIVDLYKS